MGIESGEIRRRTEDKTIVILDGSGVGYADITGSVLVGFEPQAGSGVTAIALARRGIIDPTSFVGTNVSATVVAGEFRKLSAAADGYGLTKIKITATPTPTAGTKIGLALST